jgi:hypothetical protein
LVGVKALTDAAFGEIVGAIGRGKEEMREFLEREGRGFLPGLKSFSCERSDFVSD